MVGHIQAPSHECTHKKLGFLRFSLLVTFDLCAVRIGAFATGITDLEVRLSLLSIASGRSTLRALIETPDKVSDSTSMGEPGYLFRSYLDVHTNTGELGALVKTSQTMRRLREADQVEV